MQNRHVSPPDGTRANRGRSGSRLPFDLIEFAAARFVSQSTRSSTLRSNASRFPSFISLTKARTAAAVASVERPASATAPIGAPTHAERAESYMSADACAAAAPYSAIAMQTASIAASRHDAISDQSSDSSTRATFACASALIAFTCSVR